VVRDPEPFRNVEPRKDQTLVIVLEPRRLISGGLVVKLVRPYPVGQSSYPHPGRVPRRSGWTTGRYQPASTVAAGPLAHDASSPEFAGFRPPVLAASTFKLGQLDPEVGDLNFKSLVGKLAAKRKTDPCLGEFHPPASGAGRWGPPRERGGRFPNRPRVFPCRDIH
jgi:hypothetical protein